MESSDQLPLPITPVNVRRSRNALARTLTPSYWNIDPEKYNDITAEMRAAAHPGQLIKSLVDIAPDSPCAASYIPGGSHRSGYIALTPSEYSLIPRSPESFSRSVRNTTLKARPQGDTHVQAADRSVAHALESKRSNLESYVQETLLPWDHQLYKFKVAAKNPGLSVMGPEMNMRIQFETFRSSIMGNMLEALRVQRSWNEEQYDFAARTIEARMLIDRDHNKHIAYFAGFVAMSQYYFGHKTALFKDRIQKAKQIEDTMHVW
jgi:hypothetical protein